MKNTIVLFICMFLIIAHRANALEVDVQGIGRAVITADIVSVQAMAKNEALENAIYMAAERTLGADTTLRENVSRKMQEIISQIDVFKLTENFSSKREGNTYVITALLKIDDKKFRQLVSDMGIAVNTAKSRAAGSMLVILDEYYTTPTDMKAPLRDLTEFSAESTNKHKEMEGATRSYKAAAGSSSSISGTGGVSARDGYGGSYDRGTAVRGKSSSAAMVQDKAAYARGESDFSHNKVNYKRLIEYQPKNPYPDKENYTIAAFKKQLQELDLKVLSNDLFRSKYFKKPITIEALQNSENLSKYASFARKEAKADFFSIGTAVIVDNGVDVSTGLFSCDGMVTISTYGTDGGEDIAADTVTESAQGASTNQCRTNAAAKMGESIGLTLAKNVQEYWKRRSMYGREYVINLQGKYSLATKMAFSKALQKTQGIDGNVEQRDSEYIVTYKGSAPILEAIAENLVAIPAFADIDGITAGNRVTFCPGKCQGPAPEMPANSGKKVTKGKK